MYTDTDFQTFNQRVSEELQCLGILLELFALFTLCWNSPKEHLYTRFQQYLHWRTIYLMF